MMQSEEKVEFKTIRQTAATGIITEHYLRNMVKAGECPGFYIGKRFMINQKALADKLSKMSETGSLKNETK